MVALGVPKDMSGLASASQWIVVRKSWLLFGFKKPSSFFFFFRFANPVGVVKAQYRAGGFCFIGWHSITLSGRKALNHEIWCHALCGFTSLVFTASLSLRKWQSCWFLPATVILSWSLRELVRRLMIRYAEDTDTPKISATVSAWINLDGSTVNFSFGCHFVSLSFSDGSPEYASRR